MTDNEIIKDSKYFDEDFLGNKINIGDKVIFETPNYRDFVIGKVVTKAEKTCQIEYINDWNYSKGIKKVVRQFYGQIIKDPTDLINQQKAENERLKGWQDLLKAEKHSLIKAEAVKEFAELAIKTICEKVSAPTPGESYIVEKCNEVIDNLLKETVGDAK